MTTIEHPALHLANESEITSSRNPRSGVRRTAGCHGHTGTDEPNRTRNLMRMHRTPNPWVSVGTWTRKRCRAARVQGLAGVVNEASRAHHDEAGGISATVSAHRQNRRWRCEEMRWRSPASSPPEARGRKKWRAVSVLFGLGSLSATRARTWNALICVTFRVSEPL